MRYLIGTLSVLFLIGSFITPVQAQDGWRAAKKDTEKKDSDSRDTASKTKMSAPVRLASYKKEIPLDDVDLKSGPKSLDLKTAQLQAPVQITPDPALSAANGSTSTITQATPQVVYYPQSAAQGPVSDGNCCCVSQSQPAYTTYYAPASPASVVVSGTSYTTFRPLLDLTPTPREQYIGQGIFGQPKVYVPGQPILNSLRYISP